MASVQETAITIWKSERLLYRPLDGKDEQIQNWMHEHISNDPLIAALSKGDLIRPQGKNASTDYVEALSKCLIAAVICLPVRPRKTDTETVAATPPAELERRNSDKNNEKHNDPDSSKGALTKIGFVALSPIAGSMQHHRASSVAICLTEAYQGKGYGTEAINWLVDWGFRHANLHRISIGCVSYNDRAVKLYERLGFVVEGRQRERIRFDRKWHDLIDMGMLEHEWEALRSGT